MKRILIPIFFIAVLASCTQDLEELNVPLDGQQTNNIKTADGEWISLNNGSYAQKTSEGYVMQGDIVLSEEQLEMLTSPKSRGGFTKDLNKRWPNGIVYYTIANNFLDEEYLEMAIEEFHKYTNVRFYPKNSSVNNYVEFVSDASVSNSLIGMIGGKQTIKIKSGVGYPTIMHEMGHAIGLIHEHNRYDRDNYVTIHWDNIKKTNDFIKESSTDTGISNSTTPYDYESIMHYSSNAGADIAYDTSLPVITKVDGSVINAPYFLSKEDVKTINSLYPIDIQIWGDAYCLLSNSLNTYGIHGNIPEEAICYWSVYPANSGSIVNGQNEKNVTVNITNEQIRYIQVDVTYPKTGDTFTRKFNVQASYAPIVSDIKMFKYTNENGIYTLQAVSTDKNANCTWSFEMSPTLPSINESAEFRDISYPMDAMFIESPNLFKEILFYNTGVCNVTVQASNNFGTSTYTKSNIYIYDTVGSVGFTLAPNPIVNGNETLLTILDKTRDVNTYKISIYKDNTLLESWVTNNLSNPININGLSDGEYRLVVEKDNCKSEQTLVINKQS